MTQEKINEIFKLENKKKELEEDIKFVKRFLEKERTTFYLSCDSICKNYFHRGMATILMPISERITKIALEEAEKELEEIKQKLENM
ncbi:hypothetical protein FUSNEC_GEN_129_09305 [Fusobacterium necrophorum subsp. funduliforme]|uniref:hypothetical protein n=1 Tax=Fusobacterium necrophorum TaxID=859 RepID=UPI000787670C|nr:hypothetical protein [Fusobacterium necrophorum]KYM50748.1 hypothetical protein A2U11_08560 [Fusobacterium necrophorum subsp. funduliforme]